MTPETKEAAREFVLSLEDEFKVRMEIETRKHNASVFGTVPQSEEQLRICALTEMYLSREKSAQKELQASRQRVAKLEEALKKIASGELPDGDSVTVSTAMFAEQALKETGGGDV